MLAESTDKKITLQYATTGQDGVEYRVSFDLDFCKGKRSSEFGEYERLCFGEAYDVETFLLDEGDRKAYRVIAEEGVLLSRISNMSVKTAESGDTDTNDYSIAVLIHTKEPKFPEDDKDSDTPLNPDSTDGVPWSVPIYRNSQTIDQNGLGKFQITVKRAVERNELPEDPYTEVTTDSTGVVYMTFFVEHKPKPEREEATRGGGSFRTRGCGEVKHDQARVGYGDRASTASQKSQYKTIPGTGRFILPLRYMVRAGSDASEAPCSETAPKAEARIMALEELQAQVAVVPP
ncbi:hypothetical protein GUITHDRAFT_146873 [Guillardia theta CCMP2712]|uniref:Uncharacterized protein n=1 Tax=Guillardia theta (strain CCMP2712) TaxID=905079 RepID=L1IF39_GUITC|nr:hypothetical protein GUITHDRAFT_146873 [Guillardia theta CCMP2712]EKX34861.1 hypothetical protein GUITHDRAFT_146873 [Guillardia theta CCMP2712]|eukprot:XP_005821841.1 hypothetical protein GUITHDRAFT_146873 [Guillardia theta CCMP2712]